MFLVTRLIKTLRTWSPLDRGVALFSLVGLTLVVLLVGIGFQIPPHVHEFNWQQQRISARDRQMEMIFNRPMDQASVEMNFKIEPPLPGRFFWVGQRLVYTLTQPAPYGRMYQVEISEAQDLQGHPLPEPFTGEFRTPDRQLLTVGVQGDEASRLILLNLETFTSTILTDPRQKVTHFQPSANGEKIYYFATEDTVQTQDLYELSLQSQTSRLLLDHSHYQNLQMEVSPTQDLVLVERIDPGNPFQTQLWMKATDAEEFQPIDLGTDVIGDFLITPDNSSLLMAQGQGLAILPIEKGAEEEEFLAQYGQAIALRSDGAYAALVKFGADYIRQLWIVSNTGGVNFQVLATEGSILAGEFDPTRPILYVVTTLLNPENFTESPRLLALNWEDQTETELLSADYPLELDFNLSPDGRSLAYALLQPSQGIPDPRSPLSQTGQTIATGDLGWMDLTGAGSPQPQLLSFSGASLAWIP
jgi:hypothetical protein